MKNIKILGLLFIATVLVLTGCGNKKEQDGAKINTNNDVIKDQTVEEFKMENTMLIYEDGRTTLETTVTNTSSETAYLKEFEIKVLDAEGSEITTLIGFVGSEIKAGESKVITSYCGEDLTNAVSLNYTVIR